MTREQKFAKLYQQVYLHLVFSGIYNKHTCDSTYKVTDQAIDKEVRFDLDHVKLILRLSSRNKMLSLQNDDTKILIQTEDIFLLNTILKNDLIVEKMVEILIDFKQSSQDSNSDLTFFEQNITKKLGNLFTLEQTSDFKHELDYQSKIGLYSAFQSEKFICEGLFLSDKTKYTLYERHPKFEVFSIETSNKSTPFNRKILNIFILMTQINYTKLSSISLRQMLDNSLYTNQNISLTTLRTKSMLADFQSFIGIQMSFIPQKNLGFYISSKHINQQEYEALIIDNTSVVQSNKLEVTNLTLEALLKFIETLNQFESYVDYVVPNHKQIQWIESLISSQWAHQKTYHQGLACFDFDCSKAFWVRDESMKIRKYRPFFGFDDNFSLEHTTCKLVAFPKK